jgi:hypothetical protein
MHLHVRSLRRVNFGHMQAASETSQRLQQNFRISELKGHNSSAETNLQTGII